MKKALLIGIDCYKLNTLENCVSDSLEIANLLRENFDCNSNYDVETLLESDATKTAVEEKIHTLFADEDVSGAILYFAGHGTKSKTGSYICTSDMSKTTPGVSMEYILKEVNASKIKNKIIFLDCCGSGFLGKTDTILSDVSTIS